MTDLCKYMDEQLTKLKNGEISKEDIIKSYIEAGIMDEDGNIKEQFKNDSTDKSMNVWSEKVDKISRDLDRWLDVDTTVENHFGYMLSEVDELREAILSSDIEKIKDEFGDVIYTVLRLARIYDINPDDALASTLKKIQGRVDAIEGVSPPALAWETYYKHKRDCEGNSVE